MGFYIARDKERFEESDLLLWFAKPKKRGNKWWLADQEEDKYLELPENHPLGKDLTWEMEPREVIIMDKCEYIRLMDKIAKMERRILNDTN